MIRECRLPREGISERKDLRRFFCENRDARPSLLLYDNKESITAPYARAVAFSNDKSLYPVDAVVPRVLPTNATSIGLIKTASQAIVIPSVSVAVYDLPLHHLILCGVKHSRHRYSFEAQFEVFVQELPRLNGTDRSIACSVEMRSCPDADVVVRDDPPTRRLHPWNCLRNQSENLPPTNSYSLHRIVDASVIGGNG